MAVIANIAIGLTANTASFRGELGRAGKALKTFSFRTKAARRQISEGFGKFKFFGAAAIAGLGAATNAAADFTAGMGQVATMTDLNAAGVEALSAEVLALSDATGKSAGGLSSGLYQTMSAGITDAGEAMKFLTEATGVARAGNADTADTVKFLTDVMDVYGVSVADAGKISDLTFTAVAQGKTTVSELAASMGKVLTPAKTLGISLEDLFAATTTLTKGGLSTGRAVTGLSGIMAKVIRPTEEARKAAKRLGIDFNVAGIRARGLGGFLAHVQNRTKGNVEEIGKLFGEVEALGAVLQLGGVQAEEFARIQGEMATSAGAKNEALAKVTANLGEQWKVTLNEMKNVMIRLGQAALPVILDTVKAIRLWIGENPQLAKTIGIVTGALIVFKVSGLAPIAIGIVKLIPSVLKLGKVFAIMGAQALATDFSGVAGSASKLTTVTTNLGVALGKAGLVGAVAAAGFGIGLLLDKLFGKFLALDKKILKLGTSLGIFKKELVTTDEVADKALRDIDRAEASGQLTPERATAARERVEAQRGAEKEGERTAVEAEGAASAGGGPQRGIEGLAQAAPVVDVDVAPPEQTVIESFAADAASAIGDVLARGREAVTIEPASLSGLLRTAGEQLGSGAFGGIGDALRGPIIEFRDIAEAAARDREAGKKPTESVLGALLGKVGGAIADVAERAAGGAVALAEGAVGGAADIGKELAAGAKAAEKERGKGAIEGQRGIIEGIRERLGMVRAEEQEEDRVQGEREKQELGSFLSTDLSRIALGGPAQIDVAEKKQSVRSLELEKALADEKAVLELILEEARKPAIAVAG